jgi:hypothetical protein
MLIYKSLHISAKNQLFSGLTKKNLGKNIDYVCVRDTHTYTIYVLPNMFFVRPEDG